MGFDMCCYQYTAGNFSFPTVATTAQRGCADCLAFPT